MPLCSWLLSTLLIGQIGVDPAVPITVGPPSTAPRGLEVQAATYPRTPALGGALGRETPAAPARSVGVPPSSGSDQPPATPARATTAQLLADALTLPPGSSVSGQPVPLVSVVATAPLRQRQIEAVHAYWRLAEAVAEYHVCYDRQQRLARLRAGNNEATDLRTAQATAAAQMREAEVLVTSAQHDLAEILLLTPGTPLPLPADQPLVGPYRTLFAEMFAGKVAPERARMLDQMLPLRNRAVEGHAAALLAAEDALDAAIELQASGQARLADVVTALDSQVREQRAFLAAVCRYNHDIADYALVVVSPQTTPELLVGTLIKQNRPAGQPVVALPTTATIPASFQQPIMAPASGGVGAPPAIPDLPARSAQPGDIAGRAAESPTAIPAQANVPADFPAVVAPPNPPRSDELEEPRLAPPQETAIPLLPETPAGVSQPRDSGIPRGQEKPQGSVPPSTDAKSTGGPTLHTSQMPVGDGRAQSDLTLAAYPGLAGMTPAEQTDKLTAALYRDRKAFSSAGGTPTPQSGAAATPALHLIDCLRTAPAKRRSNLIEAYWTARQIAAQYQDLIQQSAWLAALGPTLSAQNPPLPMAMLKVRRARLSIEAEGADAEADLSAAQFELACLAGLGSDKIVPQPDSVPFVGPLPFRAATTARSWSQRRLEATIPLREQAIASEAVAVVETDASRAAATNDFLSGRSPVERVLASIELQAHETSTFLQSVTDYNRAISQYTLATLPANSDAEKVVAALMVR